MQRYPGCLAAGPGRSQKGEQRRQRRINQPRVPVYAQDNMDADNKRTHENENSVGILMPAFHHLDVFILCSVGVYGEELSRAVTEACFFIR